MSRTLQTLGAQVMRYGLVLVLFWIGGMKFTTYEAQGIQPLVANSPLMSWVYDLMSVTGFSALLGLGEIVIGAMIAAHAFNPKVAAAGSAAAVVMFLTTLSFLFTTPGWHPELGFPALTVAPGQFVLKDVVLLGVSIWTLGDSLAAGSELGIPRPM